MKNSNSTNKKQKSAYLHTENFSYSFAYAPDEHVWDVIRSLNEKSQVKPAITKKVLTISPSDRVFFIDEYDNIKENPWRKWW